MKKSQLLELLKDVKDDEEIFFATKEYDRDDDSTWMSDFQTSDCSVDYIEGECLIVLNDVSEFN